MIEEKRSRPPASAELQERTLKVTNIHESVTRELLQELFLQSGPVKNVVHKIDFAFIEFENAISVAYALALMDGVHLFGKKLELQAKIPTPDTQVYLKQLREYEQVYALNPWNWWERFGNRENKMPENLCRAYLPQVSSANETYRTQKNPASTRSDYYQTYINDANSNRTPYPSHSGNQFPRRQDNNNFRNQSYPNVEHSKDRDYRNYFNHDHRNSRGAGGSSGHRPVSPKYPPSQPINRNVHRYKPEKHQTYHRNSNPSRDRKHERNSRPNSRYRH